MTKSSIRTCVTPAGTFRFGIHRPAYAVTNFRQGDYLAVLGQFADGTLHQNLSNFPPGTVLEPEAEWIYEIANPFPFRGTTYICQSWAESKSDHPERIALTPQAPASMHGVIEKWLGSGLDHEQRAALFTDLPAPIRLALASHSTDPADLIILAEQCCHLIIDSKTKRPTGLSYRQTNNRVEAAISDHTLFEVLVNNPNLPDDYKDAMVLKPGVQGNSEIIGEWQQGRSHVFEYLRRNSYIPWGHYAANMANDAIRYQINDLDPIDMTGLRHLYYQRTFCRLAEDLGLAVPETRRGLTPEELESLRLALVEKMAAITTEDLSFSSTLWGWNYGFDCAANGYRLHASHQMVHQQFAMLPAAIPGTDGTPFHPYGCGELIHDVVIRYQTETGSSFFTDYLNAILTNTRIDKRIDLESSLIVHQDDNIILFVPKAQVSQWELQMMTLRPVGNIMEADSATRRSLDTGILTALRVLTALGAQMVSSIEYPKRFGAATDQRLLYSFLPKLPFAPGAFSEAQLRFICGHFPEDFARACRKKLSVYS
ncbi:MAG: hypothetical protein KKD63_13890 [Proteobacteria bacterium]|nr:hypothetical protein [Desulfobulbaceae bacterium]MBU4153960.1 hypothetical protein [Pseudomonadota bacterium]